MPAMKTFICCGVPAWALEPTQCSLPARSGRTWRWDYDGTLQDENLSAGRNFEFARNLSFNADSRRDMERFVEIDFEKSE